MIPLPDDFLRIPLAHRGYHNAALGRIENSVGAIRAAIDAGYGIELDLQPSLDGQAVVFHDATLDRLTAQTGQTAQYTAAALGEIALKNSTDTIPTLPEILDLVDGQAPLLIELKSQPDRDSDVLEQATAHALHSYQGPAAVMSFDPRMIARLVDILPDVPRGLVTGSFGPDWQWPDPVRDRLRMIPDYHAVKASFISHELCDLDRPRVQQLKVEGTTVLTWTVTSQAQENEARKVADNITFEGYVAARP